MGAGLLGRGDRVDVGRRVRLEFKGTQLSSDGGLLVVRALDDAPGFSCLVSVALNDTRRGKTTLHRLNGLFRQSVFGRLAGYADVNDADRLALDPVRRRVVGGRAVDIQAASASRMGRFETETLASPENRAALASPENRAALASSEHRAALASPENRAALAGLNGQWIDRFRDRNGLKYIVLDMDSSVGPPHGDHEGAARNGHVDRSCHRPNFLFNRFGMLERCAPRHGNVHSADGRRYVLDPVIAKIDRHPVGLGPRVGFIVTNLPMDPDWVVRFYNQRGTAGQRIKEGKHAFRRTRLSCNRVRDNEVRQRHAPACNPATFPRCIELHEAMYGARTSLQPKPIGIGARVVRHARAITFQLAGVAVTGPMVRAILAVIRRRRAPPSCA